MAASKGDAKFLGYLEELKELHKSKGGDYASEADPLLNYVTSAEDNGLPPWRAAQLRLSEKYRRLMNLSIDGRQPNHESLDDTLMDIAALALIVRSLRSRIEPVQK
jgi:hypothetical protein